MPAASVKPVYALVGSDPFLQLEALRDILSDLGDAQRADFDGDRANLTDIFDELRSYSMFGPGKVVVVREAELLLKDVAGEEDGEDDDVPASADTAPRAGADNRARLEKFITAVGEGSETVAGTLILRISSLPSNQRLYKAVQKAGEVIKCDPPKRGDLPAWVLKRCKSVHKVEIEPAAASQLAELVGDDLGRLDSELSKLAIQCDGGKITGKDVAGSVSFQREQEIWEITTLLGRGVTKQAVERYRQIVQADPSAQYRMITWLGILLENYRTLLIAREKNLNLSGVAKSLRIFDDRVLKEYLTAAGKLGRAGVTERLARLTDLDRRIKTGLAEAAEGIERYIATLHA